jgi:plasmid maintenance system antidote protein VapI
MDVIQDFEDILELFGRHRVRYLIVGGLAFIYHAKPRYTKDIDLWIAADHANVRRANRALEEFGSPMLMTADDPDEILQLGVAPNRIDIIRETIDLSFDEAWPRRIESNYGRAPAKWIDLDSLLAIKSAIDHPRHKEDARVLRAVRDRRRTEES